MEASSHLFMAMAYGSRDSSCEGSLQWDLLMRLGFNSFGGAYLLEPWMVPSIGVKNSRGKTIGSGRYWNG